MPVREAVSGVGAFSRPGGFTLAEFLVTLLILIVLGAVVAPTMTGSVRQSQDFRCQTTLRRTTFDFTVFATEESAQGPGHAAPGFDLTSFIESVYGVMTYWRGPDREATSVPASEVFGCARVETVLSLDPGADCLNKAVGPNSRAITYGFNARLLRAERPGKTGREGTERVRLGASIVGAGRVPLVWDVDGAEAERRGRSAHYSAPGRDPAGFYGDNRFWFPAARHRGGVQVGFVDGSVGASPDPLRESAWGWGFQTVE